MALLFVCDVCLAQGSDGVGSYGSLAVFVPTAAGLVVCTDKREWNSVSRASDTETKVYIIDQKAALTITGSVAILDPTTLQPLFSVKDLAIQHLKDEAKPRFVDRIQSLPKALNDAYVRFIQGGGKELEQSPGATDDIVSSITVWYVSQGRVNINQVQLHNRRGAVSGERVSYEDVTEEFGRKLHIDGQIDFVLAAISIRISR